MHRLVSPFILDKYAAGETSGRFEAAALFVDMSGFSAMTSKLMVHGQHGAEVLATVMRAIFDPLVEAVYAYGGFITVFAGDAFTAVFPVAPSVLRRVGETPVGEARGKGESQEGAVLAASGGQNSPNKAFSPAPQGRGIKGVGDHGEDETPLSRGGERGELSALAAAWTMCEHMRAHPSHATPYGVFEVAVKIGLAAGGVRWGIVRSEDDTRAAFYFRGPAIEGATEAERCARQGDLILHPTARTLLADHVVGDVGANGRSPLLRVTGLTGAQPLPEPQPVNLSAPDRDLLARFYPAAIIEQTQTGEFRQAINVFIGLEGDPTEAQLARFVQTVFKLQAKYGGLLNRVDFGDKGCSLLLFWGAPVSYENDLLRALNFLLELHDQVNMPFRTGVTSRISHAGFIGSLLHEEYTCYGAGVNLAARFMQAAPSDSIWVDEPISLRVANQFDLASEGEHPFKGFGEPQAVFALLGLKATAVMDFYDRKIVGRKEELARLAAFVGPLFAGRETFEISDQPEVGASSKVSRQRRFAGVLVVSGEAGIGKSRLLHEFRQTCQAPGDLADLSPQWFLCQTDQILRQPLNPFRYWLRDYFGQSAAQSEAHNKRVFSHRLAQIINATADEALQGELERERSVLGALIDLYWDDSRYARLDPQSRYESTFNALKTLILAESLRQPVILQLEDVHWLDDDSCRFVERLVRHIEQYPIAIIATARPEGAASRFSAGVAHERLELTGLAAADLAGLAADLLGGPAGPRLLALLSERAVGNPFFAEQILLYLRDEGLLDRTDTGWEPREKALRAAPLPTNVRAIFIARLDRLAHDVREVVQTAAVLGREFELQVLARMLRHEALRQEVAVAEAAAIWTALTEMRYLFKHVLLRDAAYDMQVRARRGQLHQLAAETLETLHADDLSAYYGELAYHYEAACLAGVEMLRAKARTYLTLAGEQARAKYENTAAIDYFTRSLAVTPEAEMAGRFELLLEREALYNIRGEREPQLADLIELEALADALKDDSRRAEAALRRAEYHTITGDYPAAIASAERVIAFAQAAGDVARQASGYYHWGENLYRMSDYASARTRHDEGLALVRTADTPELANVEATIYRSLGYIADELSAWADARAYQERALAIYRSLDDLAGEMAAYNSLGIIFYNLAENATARSYFEQALALCHTLGRRSQEGRYLGNLANVDAVEGKYAAARERQTQALLINQEIGNPSAVCLTTSNLAVTIRMQGDFAAARSLFEQALAMSRETGNRQLECQDLCNLSQVCNLMGDYVRAREYGEQALALARELGVPSNQAYVLAYLGDAHTGLGDPAAARQAFDASAAIWQEIGAEVMAMEARAGAARAHLAIGDTSAALSEVQTVIDFIKAHRSGELDHGLTGAEEPLRVLLTCYQVLAAVDNPAGPDLLRLAHAILQQQAAQFEDAEARQQFLDIFFSREIVDAYRRLEGIDVGAQGPAPLPSAPLPTTPVDLSSGELAYAKLAGETLSGLLLRGADLNHADLHRADLAGADLRGADLSHANLRGADLTKADLRRVDLTGADLRGANLAGASLQGADLTDVQSDERTCWPEGFAP